MGALPLECDLIAVDETSMVDVPLMIGLFGAIPPSADLPVVGDVDHQSSPWVGPSGMPPNSIGTEWWWAGGCARSSDTTHSRIITTSQRIRGAGSRRVNTRQNQNYPESIGKRISALPPHRCRRNMLASTLASG
jgi:ATP-dependent exoDNAse (exonuclease V) alpha subunit